MATDTIVLKTFPSGDDRSCFLEAQLRYFSEQFGVWICVKDLVGFTRPESYPVSKTWKRHMSPVCLLLKTSNRGLSDCTQCKYHANQTARKGRVPFLRRCHLGLGELYMPILSGNKLIGNIEAGHFDSFVDDEEKARHLERIALTYDLDLQALVDAFEQSVVPGRAVLESLVSPLRLIAEHLSTFYRWKYFHPASVGEDQADSGNLDSEDETHWLMEEAIHYMKLNYARNIRLKDIAREVCLSPCYFSRLFKEKMGISCRAFLNRIRVEAGRVLLRESNLTVSQVAFEVGFNDSNYFSKVFHDLTGMTASEFRKG